LVDGAAADGIVSGRFAAIARGVVAGIHRRTGKNIPMNIDGATAAIFCELGFAPQLGRGLFILSRSVGILAHAWEQMLQGGRIKGPMPKEIPYTYAGPAPRKLERGEK
ncbi:MAG: citryl-CoA lyase, partial [Alphaproteobacteria bacterium]|nr:citryl-CoA lyase [Alphaproteobacteria bacterium]